MSDLTDWAPWYAWRPVRLYMTGKVAWLSWIFRRCVIHSTGFRTCDYTDQPEDFPAPPDALVRAAIDAGQSLPSKAC